MHRIGRQILGRDSYTVTGVHAKGGQSHILSAQSHRHGTRVAIKVPHAAPANEGYEHARREARLLKQLTASNADGIVRYVEDGTWEGRPFLASEFLEGDTLEARMSGQALPLPESLHLFIQLCTTLEGLHTEGVVHADVGPRNIILKEGCPILVDFGMARERHEPILSGGSIGYLAPEALTAIGSFRATDKILPLGGTTQDLYALGVLLYEMVTGELPFHIAPNVANIWYAMAYQHLCIAPPRITLAQMSEKILELLNALVQSLLAKRPEQRPTLAGARTQAQELLSQLTHRDSFSSPPVWFRRLDAASSSRPVL